MSVLSRCDLVETRIPGPGNEGSISGFLEITGDPNPVTSPEITKNATPDKKGADPATAVYVYSWTLCVTGHKVDWVNALKKGRNGEDGILVQFLFHTSNTGFRVKELAATVRQLAPNKKVPGVGARIVRTINKFKPLIQGAGELIGGAGKTIANAITGFQIDAAPEDEYGWYVKTITAYDREQGVEWFLPKQMIASLGNRISGGVAILFHHYDRPTPDAAAQQGRAQDAAAEFDLEARACLRFGEADKDCVWIPPFDNGEMRKPLMLTLTPRSK